MPAGGIWTGSVLQKDNIGDCYDVIGYTEESAKKKWGEDKVKIYKSSFINMLYSPA